MPRESPWEPVPPDVAAKMTATAGQNKPTATPPGDVSARLNEPFKLKIGQFATILDTPERFGVKFHSVKQDSRCPRQVNCAETGQVSLVLQPLRDSIELPPLVTVTLNPGLPDEARVDFSGYQVQLTNVEPSPERDWAEKEIAPDAYVATLIVSQSIPTATPIAPVTTVTPTVPVTTAVPMATSTPISPTGLTARLNEPFTLPMSHWATLPEANNLRVIFTTMREDSRCPKNVNCSQPGKVRVLITVQSGGQLAQFDLSSSQADYRSRGAFDGYVVELISLDPLREQIDTKIPLSEYRVTLRVSAGSFDAAKARAGQPFTLKMGQTAALADAQVQVTFEAVQQDSRCPTRVTCATSGQAKVVITLQYGDKTDRLTLAANPDIAVWRNSASDSPAVFLNALTPYPQNEFASKEITPDEYEATLVIVPPARWVTPSPQTTLTPQLAGCPALTRGDAAEILGEAVKETPAEFYFFQPADDPVPMHGLCGYGSVAFTPNPSAPKNTPAIFPETTQSDHAVIAAKLADFKRQEQLVSLASAVNAADASGDALVLYPKMLTFYAAGAWFDDMLGDFVSAGPDLTGVRINQVEGLGDSAIWVWREFAGGRYAALVAQKGETLFVVAALTFDQRTEEGARIAMTGVMKKMLQ